MAELPFYGANVREAGARGDGTGDDSGAFEALLARGEQLIIVPPGEYPLARPIRLRSGTRLIAHPAAHLKIASGAEWGVRDALVTNADWEGGDSGIEVHGGMWDGNAPHVRRAAEDERTGYTGNLLLFRNVEGLVLSDMKLKDPSSYFVCLGAVRRFLVADIRFEILHHTRNQDGIHVSGFCEDGVIRDISGIGKYCPRDDLVALNADDALDRSETRAALAGPIRRIVVSRLRAEDCHAFMRFASVWSPIEDIDVSDLSGGCLDVAINADALRFCRSPLFDIDDPRFAQGCGCLRNVRIRGCRVYKTRPMTSGVFQLHSRMHNCVIEDVERILERDCASDAPTIDLGFTPGAKGWIAGVSLSGQSNLEAQSRDVAFRWHKQTAPSMGHLPLAAGFEIGGKGRLRGSLDRLHRLHVETTPEAPLPEPNWTVGMRETQYMP